jgi:hypothetical protein
VPNGTFDTQQYQIKQKRKEKTVYEHLLYCKQVDNEALLCDGAKGRKKNANCHFKPRRTRQKHVESEIL